MPFLDLCFEDLWERPAWVTSILSSVSPFDNLLCLYTQNGIEKDYILGARITDDPAHRRAVLAVIRGVGPTAGGGDGGGLCHAAQPVSGSGSGRRGVGTRRWATARAPAVSVCVLQWLIISSKFSKITSSHLGY